MKTNSDLSTDSKEQNTKYDLEANILYEGDQNMNDGVFKVNIHSSSGHWYQIQDLFVDEVAAEVINLSETYIQIWKRQTE